MRWRKKAPQCLPVVQPFARDILNDIQMDILMDRCKEAAFENSDLVMFFDIGPIANSKSIALQYRWRTHSIERIL